MRTRTLTLLAAILLAAALLATGGCSRGKVVTRTDVDEQIDLSGNWNDTDSRLVATALVDQATRGVWIEEHLRLGGGERPTIIIGPIRNKTTEHIPAKTLVADLEREFINSGRVKVVASSEERDAVREERADQQEYSSPETTARWGRERGADYMLLGEVNTIVDREDGQEVKYYQVDTYLTDLESNMKVWTGFEKIKKFVGRSKYRP